jgi:hypothetical protein
MSHLPVSHHDRAAAQTVRTDRGGRPLAHAVGLQAIGRHKTREGGIVLGPGEALLLAAAAMRPSSISAAALS